MYFRCLAFVVCRCVFSYISSSLSQCVKPMMVLQDDALLIVRVSSECSLISFLLIDCACPELPVTVRKAYDGAGLGDVVTDCLGSSTDHVVCLSELSSICCWWVGCRVSRAPDHSAQSPMMVPEDGALVLSELCLNSLNCARFLQPSSLRFEASFWARYNTPEAPLSRPLAASACPRKQSRACGRGSPSLHGPCCASCRQPPWGRGP